jgi:lipooligosaccharide transport system permease protein
MTALIIHPTSLWHIVEHHIRRTRRAWAGLFLSGVLNPIFTMLALGFGIGSQIDDTSSLGTVDYLHFVGPGVLVGAAFVQGGFFSLWPTMSSLRWEGTYQNIVRTPASAADVLTGHLLWIGLRVAFSSTLFLFVVVISLGGTSPLAVLTPFVAALTAVAVAAPICAFTARRENDQGFALVSRLIITPLFIFSGTFTTVDSLPEAIQVVVKVFPAFHGIELTRDMMNNSASIGSAAGNLFALLFWGCLGWAAALPAFRRTLTR